MSSPICVVMCAVSFIVGFGHKKSASAGARWGGRCAGEHIYDVSIGQRFRLLQFSIITEISLLFVLHSIIFVYIIKI